MYGPPKLQFTTQHAMPRMLPNAAAIAGPRAAPAGPTGIAAFLARPGIRDALLATGSALLSQADQPGSLGGALGRALPFGAQALMQGRQEAEIDALLETAPPEMRQLLKALPSQARVPALLQMMKKPDLVAVAENERLINPETKEVVVDAVPEVVKPSADIQTFRDYLAMSDEEKAAFLKLQELKRGPGTTVNVNSAEGGIQKAIGEAAYGTITGAKDAQAAVNKVASIDRIIAITSDPKFKSGPLWGSKVGELSQRFASDPAARELLAEFNAIGGQMTMDQLEAFTGPKTDFEFRQAKRLVLNDATMTAQEIQAGLKVHRAAAVQKAKGWADNMLDLDPSRLKFDPRDVAPQLDLAQTINGKFSGGAPATSGGGAADPLGIRRVPR